MFPPLAAFRLARAVKFLFVGPLVLLLCFVLNALTYHGHWWVQWAALGIGSAWFLALFRVLRAAVLVGGLAALVAWLAQRRTQAR
jgi:hypothetical protein